MENQTIKFTIKRAMFEDFNRAVSAWQLKFPNPNGYTIREIREHFKDESFYKYIPIIIYKYWEFGCARNIDGHIFIYWNSRSADSRARTWNHFDERENNFVCDLDHRSDSFILNPETFYVNDRNYRNLSLTYVVDESFIYYDYVTTYLDFERVNQVKQAKLF